MLEEVLRGKLSARGRGQRRRWERSQERLIPHSHAGRAEDVYDSDADLSDEVGEDTSALRGLKSPDIDEEAAWDAGDDEDSSAPTARYGRVDDGIKQWGVQKMELMSTVWGKKGLTSIYIG